MSSEHDSENEESAKPDVEPIYSTNWCDLSGNLKIKCIETMELPERFRLRNTSKIERALIDSSDDLEMEFEEAEIVVNQYSSSIVLNPNEEGDYDGITNRIKYPQNHDCKHVIPLVEYILKHSTFKSLMINFSGHINMTDHFKKKPFLWTSWFNVESSSKADLFMFLDHLYRAEGIKLDACNNKSFPLTELLAHKKIIEVDILDLHNLSQKNKVEKIVQMYIDKDVDERKTTRVWFVARGTMAAVAKKFADRLVSRKERTVRIRSDNPDKHIVVADSLDSQVREDYTKIEVVKADGIYYDTIN